MSVLLRKWDGDGGGWMSLSVSLMWCSYSCVVCVCRSEQASVLRESRDRILKEKIECGQLKEGELDEQAMALLER